MTYLVLLGVTVAGQGCKVSISKKNDGNHNVKLASKYALAAYEGSGLLVL